MVVSIRVVIYKTILTLVQFKHDRVHFNERNKALYRVGVGGHLAS